MNKQQITTLAGFALLTGCLAWGIIQLRNEVRTQAQGVIKSIHELPADARKAIGF